MGPEMLRVRPEGLHECARRLAEAAYRLGHGLAGVPGLTVTDQAGRAVAALAELEQETHRLLGRFGARIADRSAAVRSAATAYEEADRHAAGCLAATPR
ncbi:type VII secretion target [Melissospora conviva]|uniref:type VII secretion target n=1 Tax=Melissospora conviva TaxID=3388432 RepID=UPI003B7C9DD8